MIVKAEVKAHKTDIRAANNCLEDRSIRQMLFYNNNKIYTSYTLVIFTSMLISVYIHASLFYLWVFLIAINLFNTIIHVRMFS